MAAFTTSVQVRFGHVDPAGIVYFPRIYDYLHEVFEEVWERHVDERYYKILSEDRVGFPLVHSEVDFMSPLRFGDRPSRRSAKEARGQGCDPPCAGCAGSAMWTRLARNLGWQ